MTTQQTYSLGSNAPDTYRLPYSRWASQRLLVMKTAPWLTESQRRFIDEALDRLRKCDGVMAGWFLVQCGDVAELHEELKAFEESAGLRHWTGAVQ